MPNHIGAFLKASRCFASLGINITRVSYNKAVDSHMLFIDAEGTPEQLSKATEELTAIGYLQCDEEDRSVVLLEFKLKDEPGSVTSVLELISAYNFNISYISSQENGTEYQLFKMGLIVDKHYSIFYHTFVDELSSSMEISPDSKNELLINTNLAMQILDETGVSPYRTFDSISRFAELLALSRKSSFEPRITEHKISDNTVITLIEPPCGSNTAIIRSENEYLFIDTGYACYKEEMLEIFKKLIPDFDTVRKSALITHADVDHCGLLPLFDEVYASAKSAACVRLEYEGNDGYREVNPLHKPYVRICKALTSYTPVSPEKVTIIGEDREIRHPLEQTGFFDFGDLHFELYEGRGGHLKGETVLLDYEHHIAFTGDIFVNLKDMTPRQLQYNTYAPILMTSVDTDKELCTEERQALFQRLGTGSWQIFGGHGGKKEYNV